VISTLWEISDRIAVQIADTFYTHLTALDATLDFPRSAYALRRAVRDIRNRYPQRPSLWAAYVHAGA
jgi:CHAT domain-containing protein